MTPAELLTELLGRVVDGIPPLLDGLTDDELAARPAEGANPVGWLVWHLARVYDDHVAAVAAEEQVYVAGGYAERFGLPLADDDIGFGHTAEQVASVRVSGPLAAEYLAAVHERASAWIAGLEPADLDRVVDEAWDPPVTLGVRLASVVGDLTQHLGQAAYVRGLLKG